MEVFMFNFRNDYHDLCHPEVLEKLMEVQGKTT